MWIKLARLDIEVEVLPRSYGTKTVLHITAWKGKDGRIHDNALKALTKGNYPGMEAIVEAAYEACNTTPPIIAANAFDKGLPHVSERPRLKRPVATVEEDEDEEPTKHVRPRLKRFQRKGN